MTPPEAENCEPVYSPPLDYLRNCKPPVPRAFSSHESYRSQQLVALAPCYIRAEVAGLRRRWPQFIQFQHTEQPRYNNDIISFISR